MDEWIKQICRLAGNLDVLPEPDQTRTAERLQHLKEPDPALSGGEYCDTLSDLLFTAREYESLFQPAA